MNTCLLNQGECAKEPSPIEGSLRDLGEDIDKLSSQMSILEDRLQSILHPASPGSVVAEPPTPPQRGSSEITHQIRSHSDQIRFLQTRVFALINRLEI